MSCRTVLLLVSFALAAFAQSPPQITWQSTSGSSTPGHQTVFGGNLSDSDGASDIDVVEMRIGSCLVHYEAGMFFLADNTQSSFLGPLLSGASLSNSYCTLSSASASMPGGSNMYLSLTLSFTEAATGSWDISMYGVDYEGLDAWGSWGTWTIGPG